MIQLNARLATRWAAEPFVTRVTTNPARPLPLREREALLVPADGAVPAGFAAYLVRPTSRMSRSAATRGLAPVIPVPASLEYLTDGDIVRINPNGGELWVMYRSSSRFNSMLVTERCNSNCIMCSQPPKPGDDRFLVDEYMKAIPLMDPDTPELGISGGEPTLLGRDLLRLITACRNYLPRTSLHTLSNGRMFRYLSLCRDVARVAHPDLMIGIPLYSDIAHRHDFVVQAAGAFDETVRGIMNLKRFGVRVEIRVVLHRLTVERLPQLARFIARNLPCVDHVALMGLEMMGYVKMNLNALWIDPADYQDALTRAVDELTLHRMHVSIYNHQLCVLEPKLWPFARKSISDWKNEYLPQCDRCQVRDRCGGFFASAKLRYSDHIEPVMTPAAV